MNVGDISTIYIDGNRTQQKIVDITKDEEGKIIAFTTVTI